MKFTLILSLFLFCSIAKAQKPERNTALMDLVVEVPRLEMNKSFEQLKGKLNRIQSMKVEGFCNSSKSLCMRFNPEQYFNVLVAINEAGYTYFIKKENVNAAINACSDKSALYIRESSHIE